MHSHLAGVVRCFPGDGPSNVLQGPKLEKVLWRCSGPDLRPPRRFSSGDLTTRARILQVQIEIRKGDVTDQRHLPEFADSRPSTTPSNASVEIVAALATSLASLNTRMASPFYSGMIVSSCLVLKFQSHWRSLFCKPGLRVDDEVSEGCLTEKASL